MLNVLRQKKIPMHNFFTKNFQVTFGRKIENDGKQSTLVSLHLPSGPNWPAGSVPLHKCHGDIFFCEEIPSLEPKICQWMCQDSILGLIDRARAPNCVSKDPATIFGMEWQKLSRMTGTKAFQSCDSVYRRLERHGWCKKSFFLTFHSKKSQKS